VIRASRAALVFWIILLVLSITVISRMTVTTDLTALLPRSADRTQELLVAQLRDGVAARLMLIGLEGGTPEALAEGSRRMATAIRSSSRFRYVSNGDPADLAAERDVLMQYRYLLSSAVVSDRFSEPALRAALERQLTVLGSPAGAVTKAMLPSDPTGELAHILSDVSMEQGPSMLHGVWFSRDGTSAQLIAETRAPGSDIDQQDAAVKTIQNAFRSSGLPETSRLLVSGPGVFAVESRTTIERDAWRLSILAAGLVTTLLFTVYRSATPVLLSLLPVLTGMAAGIALVQVVFGFVHGITLGFGATLIGEAVDYPAYLFTHAVLGERLQDTVNRIWPTLRLAVLTTVFGSVTMLLSSFTGLSQLGVLSVVGVLVAGFVTRWVLPTLASRPVTFAPVFIIPLGWSRWLRFRRAAWVVWILVLGAVIVIVLRHQDIWDNDLANLSPVSQSAKAMDERLRKELGAPDVRYLLAIRGANQEEALKRSEAAAGILHRLTQEELLTGFDLPSFYLPSRDTQRQRLAALPAPGALRAALVRAVEGLPFRTGLFQPFLRDVEQARTGTLLDLADLQHSALSLKVRSLLVRNGDEWIALAPLRGVASARSIADRIADHHGPGVVFLDLKTEAERLVNGYRKESLRLTLAGIVAIAGVLWWGLRSPAQAGRVMLPALIAVVLVMAILSLIGERLSLFHLVSLLLVVGIGLNYALFFNRPFADDADRRRTRLSVTVCILATVSAFGVLAFSQTPVLHAIGLTVTLGAFCSLIVSAMLAKPFEAVPCNP
jgi:predicted exporter